MITVTVPRGQDKWKVSFGGTPSHRKNATLIFSLIERRLMNPKRFPSSAVDEKTSILVRYSSRASNETIESADVHSLLYSLLCFLEEHLKPEFLEKKYKQYSK